MSGVLEGAWRQAFIASLGDMLYMGKGLQWALRRRRLFTLRDQQRRREYGSNIKFLPATIRIQLTGTEFGAKSYTMTAHEREGNGSSCTQPRPADTVGRERLHGLGSAFAVPTSTYVVCHSIRLLAYTALQPKEKHTNSRSLSKRTPSLPITSSFPLRTRLSFLRTWSAPPRDSISLEPNVSVTACVSS